MSALDGVIETFLWPHDNLIHLARLQEQQERRKHDSLPSADFFIRKSTNTHGAHGAKADGVG